MFENLDIFGIIFSLMGTIYIHSFNQFVNLLISVNAFMLCILVLKAFIDLKC